MTSNGCRRRERSPHIMPGDLVDVIVYLDVVVTTGHGLCPRVSVFPAFDEVTVIKTGFELYNVSL